MGLLDKVGLGDNSWKNVADEIGGEYKKGGIVKDPELHLPYKCWDIVLTKTKIKDSDGNYNGETTTFYAFFASKEKLYFKITKENVFHKVGKFFKMQDIEIGDPEFDKLFVVKSNDKNSLIQFLNGKDIKKNIPAQTFGCFEIEKSLGGLFGRKPKKDKRRTEKLLYTHNMRMSDEAEIKRIFKLFTLSLDRLVKIGAIEEKEV